MTRLVIVLGLVILAAAAPAAVRADHDSTYRHLTLYERKDRTGDTNVVCGFDVPCLHQGDFRRIGHWQPGVCEWNGGGDYWDNCTSRLSAHVPRGECVSLYRGHWYTYLIGHFGPGDWDIWLDGWDDDNLSSLRWGTWSGGSCIYPS